MKVMTVLDTRLRIIETITLSLVIKNGMDIVIIFWFILVKISVIALGTQSLREATF